MTLGSAPYLGREDQIERLADLLAAASDASGAFAVIRGAAGSGTTATARLIAERAPASGTAVLWGGFVDGLRGRPFGALAAVLDSRARQVDPANLAAELGDGASALARLAPALRATLPQIPPPAPLAAPDERLRLHDAFVGWLRRAAATQPLLVVLDDVQWADADAAALIGHLKPQLGRLPVLLLATWAEYGPTPSAADSDRAAAPIGPAPPVALLEDAAVVEIGGLDQGATRALLARVSGRPPPAAALELIQQATAGHPLTAVELYRHLHDEDMLGRAGGEEPPALEDLPRRLEEIVAWRAAKLSLEGRSALGALACFPDGASAQLLAPVAELSRTRVIEALEPSVEGGLAEVGDGGRHYSISHERVRRAVLATLSPAIRGQAYRRAAEAMEAATGDEARIQAPLLADLYARTSAEPGPSVGLRHLLFAAEQARASFGFRRAARLLRVALELGPAEGTSHSDLLLRLLQAQADAGLGDEAVATAEQIAGRPGRRVVAGSNLRVPAATPGAVDPRPLIDAARALRDHGLVTGVAALERLARAAAGPRDRLTTARLDLLAERWQDTEDEVPTSVWTGGDGVEAAERNVLHDGDEADRAELFVAQRARTHDRTVALLTMSREWRRPASLLTALRGACTDLTTRLGRWREAASWAGQYLAAAERYGSPRDLVLALLVRARCQAVVGELAAATGSLAAADEALARLGDAVDLADERLAADFTVAHYRDRDLHALIERAAVVVARGSRPAALLLAAESALAETRLDDETSARPRVEAVLAAAERRPPLTYLRDEALLVALTAAWELGWVAHSVHGMALLDQAAAAGVGGNHAATPGLAQARLHALAGRLDEARAAFADERAALDEAGLRPLRAIADHDEGIGLAAAGEAHFGPATALLRQAVDGFAALNMVGWLARTQRLLDSGLAPAAQPGGRLHFAYPLGLSRREVDLVRLVSNGAALVDAAKSLELDEPTAERHLASALAKLGADDIADLPRQARRHGLGGGT